jgi:hypothetical protein
MAKGVFALFFFIFSSECRKIIYHFNFLICQ